MFLFINLKKWEQFVVQISYQLHFLSCIAQVPWKRTIHLLLDNHWYTCHLKQIANMNPLALILLVLGLKVAFSSIPLSIIHFFNSLIVLVFLYALCLFQIDGKRPRQGPTTRPMAKQIEEQWESEEQMQTKMLTILTPRDL